MIDGLTPNKDSEEMARIRQLYKDYDVYSGEHDPAVGLFAAGKRNGHCVAWQARRLSAGAGC